MRFVASFFIYVHKFVINRLDFDLMKQGNSLRMYTYTEEGGMKYVFIFLYFLCK